MNRKKFGLALGSGGVRGLAHIGVIRTLLKHQIPIDYLSGCSIGSFVGAHFSLYLDIEKTLALASGKKKEKLMSFLEPSISGGFVRGMKMETMLNEWFNNANFADLKIPLKMAATDIINGDKVVFSEGNLATAARISMSIPGIFKPVAIESRALVDGGLSNPVPVDLVKEMGAEVVMAVNLDYFKGFSNVAPENVGLINAAGGMIEIIRHHLAQYSLRGANFVIEPPLREYSSWKDHFINSKDETIIKIAEEETEKIIPELKKSIFGEV